MTEVERTVIAILVSYGETTDAWAEPIFAVDRAMNWDTAKTIRFVNDLVARGLLHPASVVAEGPARNAKYYWKEGAA
jgi:hypothetical protein